MALSHPAHPRVTHTVGWQHCLFKIHSNFQEGYVSAQKRLLTTCITVLSVPIVLACQTASRIIFPATPNGTPQSVSDYDGDWQGTTSQNLQITFTVTRSEVIVLNIQATLMGSSCIATTISTTKTFIEPTALASGNFTPTHPIQNNTFRITDVKDSLGHKSSTIMGTFSSPNVVSGTFEYTATGTECDGTVKVDWTAKKIVH